MARNFIFDRVRILADHFVIVIYYFLNIFFNILQNMNIVFIKFIINLRLFLFEISITYYIKYEI